MIKNLVSLIASLITIKAMRLAGRGDQRFNYYGLFNCLVWTLFAILAESYGLFILNSALLYTYITNIRRWKSGRSQRTA